MRMRSIVGAIVAVVSAGVPAGAGQGVTVSLTVSARTSPLPKTGMPSISLLVAGIALLVLSGLAAFVLRRVEGSHS